MDTFIYDQNRVRQWVGAVVKANFDAKSAAIGLERNGRLIVGVVYDRFSGNDICMHVAAVPGVIWCRPHVVRKFFAYPFLQLGCDRVTGLVAASNHVARKFDEHLGFVQEGVMRKGMADGTDMVVYGMLREECRWL
jgi:hypothetical protein